MDFVDRHTKPKVEMVIGKGDNGVSGSTVPLTRW